MNRSGIIVGMGSTIQQASSNVVDLTNTLMGKPVYFYAGKNGLKESDFINAGQVILANCNDSIVGDHTFQNIPMPVYSYYGKNNTFYNISIYNGVYGFFIRMGFNFTISDSIVNTTASSGIYIFSTHNTSLFNNTVLDSQYAIAIIGSVNNTLENNTADKSNHGITLVNTYNSTIKNNTVNYNNITGIYLQASLGNKIIDNYAKNNTCGINLTMSSNYNLVSGNTLRDNIVCYYNDSSCVGNQFIDNTCIVTPDDSNPPDDEPVDIAPPEPEPIDGFNYILLMSLSLIIYVILIRKSKKSRVILPKSYN